MGIKIQINYAQEIINGNQRAGARVIRFIEDNDPRGIQALKAIYPYAGNAFVIGITGPPGSGKSTLTDKIITGFRKRHIKVGVIAIDPSSPYSGGAILGDRLRMKHHGSDKGVFIRSMATRGCLGGLTRATKETILVLDAMGYDIIIVETVGVGQDEVDIVKIAHSIALVNIPGTGDSIQTIKAGILEIGDIFVVNKADKPGADQVADQLKTMLEFRQSFKDQWQVPVVKTVACKNKGINNLVETFLSHKQYLIKSKKFAQKTEEHETFHFHTLINQLVSESILKKLDKSEKYKIMTKKLMKREIDPVSGARQIVDELFC